MLVKGAISYFTRKGEFADCVIGCWYFVTITFFASSTCTRAEYVISARISRKWKHCLPYTRWILFMLICNAQNKEFSIMNKRLHQTVACTICIFLNDALVCLVITLKLINSKLVHYLLNSITTPCMVCCCSKRCPPPPRLSPCHAAREGLVRGRVGGPAPPHRPRLFLSSGLGCVSSRAPSRAS